MAKKTPKKAPETDAADDAKFEAFLQKQFAELRAELDRQIMKGSAKAGKITDLAAAREKRAAGTSVLGYFDKWKYGIAAAVVVAVAVPMVIQVNRQRAELAHQASAPTLEQQQKSTGPLQERITDREEAEADTERPDSAVQANKNYYGKKQAAPATGTVDDRKTAILRSAPEKPAEKPGAPAEIAAGRSEGYVSKEEARAPEPRQSENAAMATRGGEPATVTAADKDGRSLAANAPAPAAPASPAPAPVFAAKKRSQAPTANSGAEAETKRDSASMADADATPAAKPRSFSLDDTNAKLKKQSIAEEEKAEMEKLWKEYEKDPATFDKDKKRSARLRTLLSRHDTKSRARRMRTVPAKQMP
ncbi:MAG: hypothetical protein U1F27_10850 [Turneriella sp.]